MRLEPIKICGDKDMSIRIFQRVLDWVDDENLIMSIFKMYVVVAVVAAPFIIIYTYLGIF